MQRVVRSSFEKPCVVGKNVAEFFMAQLDVDHKESHASQRIQLMKYQNWLSALRSQVCEWLPQCAYNVHDPQLILAADLLKLIISFKNAAWAAYQADIKACGHARADSMRGLHDAVLLCCMFGWLPPMRVSMVISLMKPDLKHECLVEACKCDGNHLHWLTPNDVMGARFFHHKTARKSGRQPIQYRLPPDLNIMLQIILEPANRRLLEMKGVQCRTVFVGTAGKEISSSMWSPYFSRLLSKLGESSYVSALPYHAKC